MKYAWITQHGDSFPMALMCDVLDVSTSGYYASVDRTPSPRARRRARIDAAVRQIHAASHGIYGSTKIARELAQQDELETSCRNTVARAMRNMGLTSRVSKAFTPTTTQSDPTKSPAPNTLDRDFTAKRPNEKWVTDITYLPTLAGWVYVAVVSTCSVARSLVGRSATPSPRRWWPTPCGRPLKPGGRSAASCYTTAIAAVSTRAMLTNRP